jgi:hypothetical protein
VNPYQVSELTNAMQILIQDNKKRSQLIDRSLQQAKQFSWEKTGLETQAVLQQFL